MQRLQRLRNVTAIVLASAMFQIPGCINGEEAGLQLQNSVRDFLTALFKTGVGNVLSNLFP